MTCGVYSLRQASGALRYFRLGDDYASSRPCYTHVRRCPCDAEIAIEDGSAKPKDRSEGGWRGMGDVAADAIHAATFGLVGQCAGCETRQELLNTWFPFRSR